jgi:hypothetical protein
MEERVLQDIKHRISSIVEGYPLKRRAVFALSTCAVLLVTTLNWKFEPAKTISICASVVACLFDSKGKWFMFFFGIVIGSLLLDVST